MKKLVLSSDAISKAMRKLSLAVNTKSILPVLRNVYCKVAKNEVQLVTSDNEITIAYTCEADTTDAPFELLIPFDFLNKVSGLLKGQPITIEHPSTRKAKIIGDDDIFELNSLDKLEDFPDVPAVPKKYSLTLDENFVSVLSAAMHTCMKDPTNQNVLIHSCLDIQEAGTNLVSTDTQALYKMKINGTAGQPDQLLFSSRLAKSLEGMGEMDLSWSQKQMAFVTDKVTVWAIRHEGKYPNYNTIIPKFDWNLSLERPVLINALSKACLSSNETKRTVLDFKKAPGKIHFETDDIDLARRIEVNIPGNYTGELDRLALNAGKLLTMMEQIDTKTIRLHINSHDKAVIVTSEENENYLGLIIPSKLAS